MVDQPSPRDSTAAVAHDGRAAELPTTIRNAEIVAASTDAEASARACGVRIREISDPDGLDQVCRLFSLVWRPDPATPHLTTELLRAMAKAGNYVAGAFQDGALMGASAGFFAAPAEETLHSHISGVAPQHQARRIGFALKLHQRAWALERGATVITWTFDPLVRRNGYFNLAKLAATAAEYLPDFYGTMHDGINSHDQTDRLLVRWHLTRPEVSRACGGNPDTTQLSEQLVAGACVRLGISPEEEPMLAEPDGSALLLAVPADIEQIRRDDPAKATRWRVALREALGTGMAGGAAVRGFDRDGWYVLDGGRR